MLWLLSMSSANVAGTRSWLTRSIACATPSSWTAKLRRLQAAHEPALPVVHAGLEQDARYFGDLGDLERLEDDFVAALVAVTVFDLDRQLAPLERVLVDPLDRVRRAIRRRS